MARLWWKRGEIKTINVEEIGERLAKTAARPKTDAEINLAAAMDEMKKHVTQYYQGWPEEIEADQFFKLNSKTDGFNLQ